ncbi:MAG TPA: FixH family protein [Deinococcales bacterium]|nr:FixH family protein [Deinococcales bacterium]
MTSTPIAHPTKASRPARFRRWATIAAIAVLALAGATAFMAWRMSYVPSGLDYGTTRPTAAGHFTVSYVPSQDPVPVNRLHQWTLSVTTPDGKPVQGASISVDGDMPQHGHGLPTRPAVTEDLGNGRYLVDGVKFQMGGWWVMDFEVRASGKADSVRFNLLLK